MSMQSVTDRLHELGALLEQKAKPEGGGTVLPELTNPGDGSKLLAGYQMIGQDGQVVPGEIPTVELPNPDISVSEQGAVKAKVSHPGGYTEATEKEIGLQLSTQGAKTVIPSTVQQTAVPKGRFTTAAVFVAPMPAAAQATPEITVSTGGLITASATQSAGYVAAGTRSATKQLTVQAAQTITPSTEDQRIPAYHYIIGEQVIEGDPNLRPENIVNGKTIFGVDGTASTGVEQPNSLALDPDVVYATTRPKDWLPIPTPDDDEIYILCHVINGLTATVKFRLTGSSDTVVELGTVVDGTFVAKETVTNVTSKEFVATISSDDYMDLTSDGRKQCMVRIKGGVTGFNGVSSNGPHPGVEFVCGIALDSVQFGYTSATQRCWAALRYVTFVGNGGAKNLNQAFYYNLSLVCVRCESPNIVTDVRSAFRDCHKLVAVSGNIISDSDGAIRADYLFQNTSIPVFPKFRMTISSAYAMFAQAYFSRVDMANVDTSACADFSWFCRYGYCFDEILDVDISALTNADYMFTHQYNLRRLTFAGETTPGGVTIDIENAIGLSHAALLETLNSLPAAIAPATLDISNAAGASDLTDDEIAIATAKNWTITI